MAVDTATKKQFNDKLKELKEKDSEFKKDIAAYQKAITQTPKLEPFFRFGVISKFIDQANLAIDMNDLSEQMMGVKNNSYLDNARKAVYKIYGELEKIVTNKIDEPLDFNREELDKIKPFNARKRLNLHKHLKKLIERLIRSYGENTKWRWSFPEIWSNLAVYTKNLTDFREIQAIRDPREEFYYDREELLGIVKEDLFSASNHFRDKYELSTKSNNDLLHAIRLLESLKRIGSLMGDEEVVKKTKSGIEAYKSRIEASEEDKKKPAAKAAPSKKKKKKSGGLFGSKKK